MLRLRVRSAYHEYLDVCVPEDMHYSVPMDVGGVILTVSLERLPPRTGDAMRELAAELRALADRLAP